MGVEPSGRNTTTSAALPLAGHTEQAGYCAECSTATDTLVRWPCTAAAMAASRDTDHALLAVRRGRANLAALNRGIEALTPGQADTVRAYLVGTLVELVDEFEFAALLDRAVDYTLTIPSAATS